MIPSVFVGNPFEMWLNEQWDTLLDIRHTSIVAIQHKIAALIAANTYQAAMTQTNGQPLANYALSLQFVDAANLRCGPWSFMDEEQWRLHQALVTEDCDRRWAQPVECQ